MSGVADCVTRFRFFQTEATPRQFRPRGKAQKSGPPRRTPGKLPQLTPPSLTLTVRVAVQYDRPPPSLRTHILQPFLMSVGGVYYQFRDRCFDSVALVQMRKPCDVCRKRPYRRVRCHFCRLHIGHCCTHWSWFESTGLAGSFWIIECSRCVAPPEPEPEP